MEAAVPLVIVVMGVMGCGKSTVAGLLAQALRATAYEGDSFHPPANIAKMRAGIPLCDDDRWPWLQQLADIIQRHLASGQRAVLSCSALKPAYRQLLRTGRRGSSGGSEAGATERKDSRGRGGTSASSSRPAAGTAGSGGGTAVAAAAQDGPAPSTGSVGFVLLDPPLRDLQQRLRERTAAGTHFTPGTALLRSQLAALDYDEAELLLHVRGDPFPPAHQILATLLLRCGHAGWGNQSLAL